MKTWTVRGLTLALLAFALPACGGGGGGGGGGGSGVDTDVIAGPGGHTFTTSGGDGSGGDGGMGGLVEIEGAAGSAVNVLGGARSVDTSFTVPAIPAPILGPNPHVAVTGTIDLDPTVGQLRGTVNPALAATGLHVPAGVTLTLERSGGSPAVNISLTDALYLQGTLAVAKVAGSPDSIGLSISCSNFFSTPGASISAYGADSGNLGVNGGEGGKVFVFAREAIVNGGSIHANGGDALAAASTGGQGGEIILSSNAAVFNTGSVQARGGGTNVGSNAAGDGGSILFESAIDGFGDVGVHAGLYNSGSLNTSAGASTGPAGAPGAGGPITLRAGVDQGAPRLVNSGDLFTSGSNSPTVGGPGGAITISCESGAIRFTGTLTSRGGTGGLGAGGAGGAVDIRQIGNMNGPSGSEGTGFALITGGISLAADIDTSGGDGTVGGIGGLLRISQEDSGTFDEAIPGLNPINIVGLASITTRGGAGTLDGGNGGAAEVRNLRITDGSLSEDGDGIDVRFVGPIRNEVAITTRGGTGTGGLGGTGGTILVYGDYVYNPASAESFTTHNQGALDSSGGDGATGGTAGYVDIFSSFRTTNSALITTSGGMGTAGPGGPANSITIGSVRHAENSGTLIAVGGDSASSTGGDGGAAEFVGSDGYGADSHEGSARNTGPVTTSGGNGSTGGGNGGEITFVDHYSVYNSGLLTSSGGTTVTGSAGDAGAIFLLSDGRLESRGAMVADGGDATNGFGGSASEIRLLGGSPFSHIGDIDAIGGSGNFGGDGGTIRFNSTSPLPAVHGTMNVSGGAGASTGNHGHVYRNGLEAALSLSGTVTF